MKIGFNEKVTAGTVGAHTALAAVWLLGQFGVEVTPEVGVVIAMWLTLGAAWLKKEHPNFPIEAAQPEAEEA